MNSEYELATRIGRSRQLRRFNSIKMKKIKQFDGLILEIRSILSENRCSYSESQKAALNECISLLQNEGLGDNVKSQIPWELIIEIVKIITVVYFEK